MKKYIISFYLFIVLLNSLNAQEQPLYYLGGSIYYNYNLHFPNFTKLGQIPNCCPNFGEGYGSGFTAGLLIEFPIINNINVGARLNYATLDGLLSKEENIGNQPVYIDGNETTREVWVNHSIDAKISIIGINPYINYRFFNVLNSNIGFTIAYQSNSIFDQKEEIIKPDNTTFYPTNRLIRNDFYDMEVPGKNSFLFFANFSLGYDIDIFKNWILTPEIIYFLPLNNLGLNDWKVASLKFGVSVKIPIYPSRELPIKYDTLIIRDTTYITRYDINKDIITLLNRDEFDEEIPREDYILKQKTVKELYKFERAIDYDINISLKTFGVNQNNEIIPVPVLKIEEFESEERYPLLPYIFFKRGEWNLNNTDLHLLSKNEADEFSIDNLNWEVLEIYKEMLNILGYRLKKNPKSKIKIVGCNNNQNEEFNNLELSKKRALAVSSYLKSVWDIDETRMQIKVQNLPDNPGNINEPDGIMENQRVEIHSDDFEILSPLSHKEIIRKSNPPIIGIYPQFESKFKLKNYNLDIYQSGKILRNYSGNKLPEQILWEVTDKPMPEVETPIDIKYSVIDENGKTADTSEQLLIKQVTIQQKRFVIKDDKIIEKYHLILFDFDSYELKKNHKIILNELKQRIQKDSKVKISGYTDRIGLEDYNKNLALKRCEEVRKYLNLRNEQVEVNPVGSSILLYNNDLPQGRNYCRTVILEIETPINN